MRRSDDPAAALRPARDFTYVGGADGAPQLRWVAVEAPIALEFGGQPHAVMMASPIDLVDFAYGFALTEGIVDSVDAIRGVECETSAAGRTLKIALSGPGLSSHLARRRALVGRTACGLCGVEDFAAMPKPARVKTAAPIAPSAIKAAVAGFEAAQRLNALTRSVHGAAWCGRDGRVAAVREDVGRHNALDKVIGAMARERADPADGFLLISSRCSLEMVAKTARFGAATLVSVSAPTALALDEAARLGITIVAVARADHGLVFDAPKSQDEAAA